jgi:hypothetical protein
MIVFRPFIGELLVGKIKTCTPEGVRGNYITSAADQHRIMASMLRLCSYYSIHGLFRRYPYPLRVIKTPIGLVSKLD